MRHGASSGWAPVFICFRDNRWVLARYASKNDEGWGLLTSVLLRLHHGNSNGVIDVVFGAASGEVVGRFGEALQKGPNGLGAANTFGEFVADVAGFKVGEDEDVGVSAYF